MENNTHHNVNNPRHLNPNVRNHSYDFEVMTQNYVNEYTW